MFYYIIKWSPVCYQFNKTYALSVNPRGLRSGLNRLANRRTHISMIASAVLTTND